MIGGFLRFFGGYAFGFFSPVFFQAAYPQNQQMYSILNATLASLLCLMSSVGGGILSDTWRKHDPMSKAYITIISSLGAVPFVIFCFLYLGNFTQAIVMLSGNYLIAEAWASPAITMLLDSSKGNPGFTVNVYFLFATAGGALSTAILNALNKTQQNTARPIVYGDNLCYAMLISYIGCSPAFFMAGRSYKKSK